MEGHLPSDQHVICPKVIQSLIDFEGKSHLKKEAMNILVKTLKED